MKATQIKLVGTMEKIEYWYDRSQRTWWARRIDFERNQIGDALFSSTFKGIQFIIGRDLLTTSDRW